MNKTPAAPSALLQTPSWPQAQDFFSLPRHPCFLSFRSGQAVKASFQAMPERPDSPSLLPADADRSVASTAGRPCRCDCRPPDETMRQCTLRQCKHSVVPRRCRSGTGKSTAASEFRSSKRPAEAAKISRLRCRKTCQTAFENADGIFMSGEDQTDSHQQDSKPRGLHRKRLCRHRHQRSACRRCERREFFRLNAERIKELEEDAARLQHQLALNPNSSRTEENPKISEDFRTNPQYAARLSDEDRTRAAFCACRKGLKKKGCEHDEERKRNDRASGSSVKQKSVLGRTLPQRGICVVKYIERRQRPAASQQQFCRPVQACRWPDKRNRPRQAAFRRIERKGRYGRRRKHHEKSRIGQNAHDKKRIAREEDSEGDRGLHEDSAPSAGIAFWPPRRRPAERIPGPKAGEDVNCSAHQDASSQAPRRTRRRLGARRH